MKQGISAPIIFTMKDSGGALEPNVSGISVELSKNGGSFATPAGTVSEIGKGYYKLSATTANVDTIGPCKLYAWKAGTSIRGGTEYEVEPKIVREVFGGTIQHQGAAPGITFQLLDSNGAPVDSAVTGGYPVIEFRHTDYPWATLNGAPVYEISPAGRGMYYLNDTNGYINAVKGTAYLFVSSTVKDATALVRFQIV